MPSWRLVALAPAPHEAEEAHQALGRLRLVGEHVDVLLGVQPRDQDRLLARVLAYAAGAVARAEARLLPAAHRQLERGVVDHRVVDADRAGLDAPRDLLA